MTKVLCIIQARTSSTRLPSKVLKQVLDLPLIVHQLLRVRRSQSISKIVLATSTDASDDNLSEVVSSHGFDVYRGDLDNVLTRFYKCAILFNRPEVIIRLTGDCPFSDPEMIDLLVSKFIDSDYSYLSNVYDESNLTVPDGFDIEIFTFNALELAFNNSVLKSEVEHVTPWMKKNLSEKKIHHFCHHPLSIAFTSYR